MLRRWYAAVHAAVYINDQPAPRRVLRTAADQPARRAPAPPAAATSACVSYSGVRTFLCTTTQGDVQHIRSYCKLLGRKHTVLSVLTWQTAFELYCGICSSVSVRRQG